MATVVNMICVSQLDRMCYLRLMNCYRCEKPLKDANRSEEHVINNALGGHLTSFDLLCDACNNFFGHDVDAELEKQIGMVGDLLGIKRHREKNDRRIRIGLLSEKGDIKIVGRKMRPLHELHFDAGEKTVVLFEDEGNYESLRKRKQRELERKFKVVHNEYETPPDKTKFHMQNSLSDGQGNIAFGGRGFFRGVSKIALNYYLSRGYDRVYAQEVLSFVKGNKEFNDIAYFYYPKHYNIHQRQEDEVIHLIHIKGDTHYKILYAYVELFSCHNAVVIFNLDYAGPAIESTYTYDLIAGEVIDKQISMWLPRHHIEIIDLIEHEVQPEHLKLFNRLERIIEKRQLL